ncbi:MAG TPA: amidase [Spirochaetota bacterium]|nr:amidase [Spirochaetota bacterium]
MEKLLTCSGLQIARMIREKKISSREAVEIHIARIEKVNPVINAVAAGRFDEARKEADAADRMLRSRSKSGLPVYHGVPCTIKEAFSLRGMPNTSGLVSRKNVIGDADAACVARLRKAGAIPLGVTNVPELCMWVETYNNIYGRTNNPYDPKRIAGGSSGGEGAIIGAGGSPFGLGSDIAGSIRLPSFFNGVFGHKPTGGLVPGTGHFPLPSGQVQKYGTFGPLARRAEDLMPLLKILAGPDGVDTSCEKRQIHDHTKIRIRDIDVILLDGLENFYISPVSGEMLKAREDCARELEKEGARIRTLRIDLLKHAFPIWVSMVHEGSTQTFREMMSDGKKINIVWEMIKGLVGASDFTMPIKNVVLLEDFGKYTPEAIKKFASIGIRLRAKLADALGDKGIILFPSFPYAAPRHYDTLIRAFNFYFTGIFNVMELPATQVPVGLNGKGLPLGVQVISNHWNDHVTIGVAGRLEKIFGGWAPPARLMD